MAVPIPVPGEYITSDLHLDHEKVIEFNDRPFQSLVEMQDTIIGQINALPPKSTIYILGDTVIRSSKTGLRTLLDRIHPVFKLIFVLGNHDDALEKIFKEYGEVYHLLTVRRNKKTLVMCHYPMMEWRRGQYGAIHFYGHTHGNLDVRGKALDVGWDVHKRILPLEEAIAIADSNPIYQPCHDKNNGLLSVVEKESF